MKNNLVTRGPRRSGLVLATVLLSALVLPACDDNTTNIPNIPRAVIVVAVDPNPVIGLQNILTGSVTSNFVVQIRELAGLGGKINFVNCTIFDPETGIQVGSSYFDSSALTAFEGTSRLDGGGQLDVTQSMAYSLPNFGIDADLTVNVQLLDDNGGLINYSTLVRIVPPPA